MRSRFKKVWCEACKSMQFAGECGHARVEPEGFHTGLAIRLNGADVAGMSAAARADVQKQTHPNFRSAEELGRR